MTLMVILVVLSALLSGSEVAIFGLSNSQKLKLENDNKNKNSRRILKLIENPKKLLATILIGNNLVNVYKHTYYHSYFIISSINSILRKRHT